MISVTFLGNNLLKGVRRFKKRTKCDLQSLNININSLLRCTNIVNLMKYGKKITKLNFIAKNIALFNNKKH